MSMLEILSENRDLKQQIKEAEKMITQVEVENLPSYELGMERGMEKGIEKIVKNLLKRLNAEQVADFTRLTVAEVNEIAAKQSNQP